MADARRSSVSGGDSLESIGEFWDEHDFTEYDTDRPDAEFTVRCAVPVDARLLTQVEVQASQHGVSVETLVNLWLQQKLNEA